MSAKEFCCSNCQTLGDMKVTWKIKEKLTWQWKQQPFEDVSPIKDGDFPLPSAFFWGSNTSTSRLDRPQRLKEGGDLGERNLASKSSVFFFGLLTSITFQVVVGMLISLKKVGIPGGTVNIWSRKTTVFGFPFYCVFFTDSIPWDTSWMKPLGEKTWKVVPSILSKHI